MPILPVHHASYAAPQLKALYGARRFAGGMSPQADMIDGQKSISPETLDKVTRALDRDGRQWRLNVEWVSGSMVKATCTEEQAHSLLDMLHKKAEKKKNAETTPMRKPFCARCKEDFPAADEPGRKAWAMGQLNQIRYAKKNVRDAYRAWLDGDLHGEPWMCGSCYFDITDSGAPMHLM